MADSVQDRRLPATPRKIAKARAEGQVARSRDLGHLMTLGVGGALLVVAAPALVGWLLRLVADALRFDGAALAQPGVLTDRLGTTAWKMLVVILPMGIVGSATALALVMLAGGWNFTFKPMRPNFGKLNPIAGFGRMVSPQQLIDVLKACALALILGLIGASWLRTHLSDFTHLLGMPLMHALPGAGATVQAGLLLLLLALAIFAIVDVPLQRHLLAERLKMSHHELKEENKQSEGNPEVKGRIRARMRALAQRRMLAAVPSADIVVMNPTHYAVALKYDEATMAAPRVLAKGADLIALRIRDAARAARVPVLEAPPLARALYAHAEVDREIPAALFGAVAQVLAWVYQLRAAAARGAPMPAVLPAPEVPPGLDPALRSRPTGVDA